MMLKVCLAGGAGWAGPVLARAMARTTDLALVGVHRGLDSVLDL